jgi:hypothetical protein
MALVLSAALARRDLNAWWVMLVTVQIQREGDYRNALPETEDFFKADLRRDPAADLAQAEGGEKRAHL